MSDNANNNSDHIVRFKLTNGDIYGIFRNTLDRYPNSFLSTLVANESKASFHSRGADDAFVIDEDPIIFSAILTYYRCGVLSIVNTDLRQAILDKYMLPQIYRASTSETNQRQDEPIYVHLAFEHPSSSSTQTKPSPSEVPALNDCPFLLTHTHSYRGKDPIEIANYLARQGYTMEQIDINTLAILMKKKTTIN